VRATWIKLGFGGTVAATLIVFGLVVARFAPADPRVWQTYGRNLRPTAAHVLGTTALGQDTFWLLCWSAGNSILLGLSVAAVATVIGVFVGLLAGYKGGWVDRVLSFFMDALIVIPSLPLLILLSTLTKGQTSLLALGGLLVVFNWPFPARQIRAVALSMRERDFVSLAWFSGESTARILRRQMLPYLQRWAVANFVNTILVVVAVETSLAFLGLANDNVPTLGSMLYWALKYQALLGRRWWWIGPPIVTIVALFVSVFLVSNGLLDRARADAEGRR